LDVVSQRNQRRRRSFMTALFWREDGWTWSAKERNRGATK